MMVEEQKMTEVYRPASPYVGLTPYSEKDAPFFFGRKAESEIISANLRSARLTLFYGPSGVGKSSVLQAGVVNQLRKLAAQNMEEYGRPEFAVVVMRSWASDPIAELSKRVREAVAESMQMGADNLEPVPPSSDLSSVLEAWAKRFGIELLIILDQFEEYFTYHEREDGVGTFASEFPKTVNRTDLPVRFLISMREDTLSRLDRFKGSIPHLFDNRLQVERLKLDAAREAIEGPITAYNNLLRPGEKPFAIEPALVEQVLKDVQPEKANLGETVAAQTSPDNEHIYIETPYLQLVMTRIWNEEAQSGSHLLRLDTLNTKLKGAKEVIKTHLDGVMSTLSTSEQDIAADCFNYLVTPIGTKIALTPSILAYYTQFPEDKIASVMEKLVKGEQKDSGSASRNSSNGSSADKKRAAATLQAAREESRILNPVNIKVGEAKKPGYEVSHDALIPAILDWRSRYLVEREQRLERHKAGFIALGIFLGVILLAAGAVWYAVRKNREANRAHENLLKQQQLTERAETAEKNAQSLQSDTQAALNNARIYKSLFEILVVLRAGTPEEKANAIATFRSMKQAGEIPPDLQKKISDLVSKNDDQEVKTAVQRVIETPIVQSTGTPNPVPLKPRVYIQIQDEEQRPRAKEIQKLLAANGFIVPGIENVGARKLATTEVRYFQNDDKDECQKVIVLLQKAGIKNVTPRYLQGYENSNSARSKPIELWFSADAFGTTPPAVQQQQQQQQQYKTPNSLLN